VFSHEQRTRLRPAYPGDLAAVTITRCPLTAEDFVLGLQELNLPDQLVFGAAGQQEQQRWNSQLMEFENGCG
jgi:hypothetical protein